MADKEKKIEQIEGLGPVELVREPVKETVVDGVTKPGKSGLVRMNDKDFYKFYENNGVPNAKAVFNAINEANREFGQKVGDYLAPKVEETGADWEMHAGNTEIAVAAKRVSRDVRTGEPIVKYGKFSMKVKVRNPINEERWAETQKRIEESLKKKFGL